MKIQKPYITECNDGSIGIEWIKDSARFSINIEKDIYESSWVYVEKDGIDPQSGDLPLELMRHLARFMERE
jgi:hypothetical protein